MTNLNSTLQVKNKKMRVGRGIGSGKGKLLAEVLRGKNQEVVLQLKVLKVDKCLYIGDCQREVLIH